MSVNWFAFILVCIISGVTLFQIKEGHLGMRMNGHAFEHIYADSITVCARACKINQRCKATNFEGTYCELLSASSSEATLEPSPGSAFSDTSEWPALDGCDNSPCTSGRCFPTGGFNFVCKTPEHCGSLQITAGFVNDSSTYIGTNVEISCDVGFAMVGGRNMTTVQCMPDGYWSEYVTCLL